MVVHEHEGMDLQLDEKSRVQTNRKPPDNGSWSLWQELVLGEQ